MEESKVKLANPGPLGLICFGMTTILLNIHNASIIDLSAVIAAMGFAIGGLAQIIAGIFELKQGNTFSGTAFTAYGFFWWTLVFIWLNPGDKVNAADPKSMGFFLLLWGIFSIFMFIGSLKHGKALQAVFLFLVLLFFGLAIGDFTGNKTVTMVSGIIGIICGATAFYVSVAQLLRGEYGREILPLFEPKK